MIPSQEGNELLKGNSTNLYSTTETYVKMISIMNLWKVNLNTLGTVNI